MEITKLAAGGLNNSDLVGSSVVWVSASVGQSVGRHVGEFLIRRVHLQVELGSDRSGKKAVALIILSSNWDFKASHP